jgi:selenocysteine lyase/cysteine desulfurase
VLYLDTARLGQTSPSALETQIDFSRLTAEQPSSLYTDRFLAGGIDEAPVCWTERFPGLCHWRGVSDLKRAILKSVGAPDHCSVTLASRSMLLMRSSARAMFRRCNNVFTTDLSWPAYQAEVCDAAARTSGRVSVHRCRSKLNSHVVTADQLVRDMAECYERNGCDGVFLPAVDNFGVSLPISRLLAAFDAVRPSRFVLVDGAQAVGHITCLDFIDRCDIFLAGVHKWLRAGSPLGFLVSGRPRSCEWLSKSFRSNASPSYINDGLRDFTESLELHEVCRYTETVNVAPLLTCRAALADQPADRFHFYPQWQDQLANRHVVSVLSNSLGWTTFNPNEELHSGVILMRPPSGVCRRFGADKLRSMFATSCLSVSTYPDSSIRMSMPQEPLSQTAIDQIESALQQIAIQSFD